MSSCTLEKEPWQSEFESETVNDERWTCLVTAVVEAQLEDEECLKIFRAYAASSENSILHVITMSDLVNLLKSDKIALDNKKKVEQKGDKRVKEKQKDEENSKSFSRPEPPPPRFPNVLPLISKSAICVDGQHKLSPTLMAYALKYMILHVKDEDCFRRKVSNSLRLKKREAEIKRQIFGKVSGIAEGRVAFQSEDDEPPQEEDKIWRRSNFDILRGSPLRHGPFNGPEMYIVLSEFYDPLCFVELQRLKVPFRGIIRIEDFKRFSAGGGKTPNSGGPNKCELINKFWKELERGFAEEGASYLYKDIALVKYVAPALPREDPIEDRSACVACDLTAVVYSIFQLYRLHQAYLGQMKVHRMIESLEPLELSRCQVYTKLCDTLVTEDFSAEIFVLYSIIEQVVVGVPDTGTKINDYARKALDFFDVDSKSHAISNCDRLHKQHFERVSMDIAARIELGGSRTTVAYPTEILREQIEKRNKPEGSGENPAIIMYDDLISLRSLQVDQSIVKVEEIFQRFVVNSALTKIMNRFPRLTEAQRAQNDFQFFRFWEKSKESEENFKVKMFFSIAMRLIEHTEVFDGGCEDRNSSSQVLKDLSDDVERSESLSDVKMQQGETFGNCLFYDTTNSFYREIKNNYFKGTSTKATVELRKANAISDLAGSKSTLFEELEVACGACPKVDPEERSGAQDNVAHLEQLLESYEISYLNEPNLLIDRSKFEAYVRKHNFCETLEPRRALQRLQNLYDDYHTVECTYFSPTDTLFILGQNDTDFRGVYHSSQRGYIISPLSLRDFVIYVLPENRRWAKEEDSRYIQFLIDLKEIILAQERKKDHERKCKLLETYRLMTLPERRFENEYEACEQANGINKSWRKMKEDEYTKRESKTGGQREKTRKGEENMAEEMSGALDDMEELPIKAKQPLSCTGAVEFCGFNLGDVRTQVNSTNNEFHSDDGTLVRVRTQSWLYKGSVISLAIRRLASKLYFHKWMEGERMRKSLQLRTPSDILVTAVDAASDPLSPLLCKVTWPSGLIIEPLPLEGTKSLYIKQTYLDVYRKGEDIESEKYRCHLLNGQVLIFRTHGAVDILCPSGTKYGCHKLTTENKKKKCCSQSDTKQVYDIFKKLQIEIYDILTPEGEFWVRDEYSKCRILMKTMTLLTGVDAKTNETFFRREDGTNYMLWPGGKLVTTFPDGTKITSVPQFEDEEILIESEYLGKGLSVGSVKKRGSSTSAMKHADEPENADRSGITFLHDANVSNVKDSDGFVVITCSYLLEHPKYATVYCEAKRMQLRMPEKMKLDFSPWGSCTIESHNSVLKVEKEYAEFYNACRHCNRKSTSTISLGSTVNTEDVLSKTKDFYGQKFVVYNSGHILRKGDEEDGAVKFDNDGEEMQSSQSLEGNYTNSVSKDHVDRGEHCEHHRMCKPLHKCLVLERDMTGMEFISDSAIHRYVGRLSEDTYYDLSRPSADNSYLRHGFYEPAHITGRETYLMKYEENDAYPTRLKRKDLRARRNVGSLSVNVSENNSGDNRTNRTLTRIRKKLPEAVIVRFIRVLQPDPVTIMNQITAAIALYQKRAKMVTQTYRNHSEQRKQTPFATYIAKELHLIASTLCQSMTLYPHTCTIIPDTELDMHSVYHNINLNDYLVNINPVDVRVNILPRCKRIRKPLRHGGRDYDIPERPTAN